MPQVYPRNKLVEKMKRIDEMIHMSAAEAYTGLDPITSKTHGAKRDETSTTQPSSSQETWKGKAEVHQPAFSVVTERDHATTPTESETEALLQQCTAADPFNNNPNENVTLHPAPGIYRRKTIHSGEADHHSLPLTGGVALRPANAVYGEVGDEE
jgi:hypothetical protein